jgi:hypothetical protein
VGAAHLRHGAHPKRQSDAQPAAAMVVQRVGLTRVVGVDAARPLARVVQVHVHRVPSAFGRGRRAHDEADVDLEDTIAVGTGRMRLRWRGEACSQSDSPSCRHSAWRVSAMACGILLCRLEQLARLGLSKSGKVLRADDRDSAMVDLQQLGLRRLAGFQRFGQAGLLRFEGYYIRCCVRSSGRTGDRRAGERNQPEGCRKDNRTVDGRKMSDSPRCSTK